MRSDYCRECDEYDDVKNKKAPQMRDLRGFQYFQSGRYWISYSSKNAHINNPLRHFDDILGVDVWRCFKTLSTPRHMLCFIVSPQLIAN